MGPEHQTKDVEAAVGHIQKEGLLAMYLEPRQQKEDEEEHRMDHGAPPAKEPAHIGGVNNKPIPLLIRRR